MNPDREHVVVEHVAWSHVLRWLVLFRAFRMAIQPTRMFLGLLLVVAVWVVGSSLDAVWPRGVYDGEVAAFHRMSATDYRAWLSDRHENDPDGATLGVFETAAQIKFDALANFHTSPIDSAFALTVTLPGWLMHAHPVYLLIYGLINLVLWAAIGGSLARSAAVEATTFDSVSIFDAIGYARKRFAWLVLTPIAPFLFVFGIAVGLALYGLVLMSLPVLNVLGALLYGLALVAGVVYILVSLLAIVSHPLYYPAICIDGADPFEAISRSFSYVMGRPWHYLFYGGVTWMYGAVCFLFVSGFATAVLVATDKLVQFGAARDTYTAVAFSPEMFAPLQPIDDWSALGATDKAVAGIVRFWAAIIAALPLAFAASFYVCGGTFVYLLLRRSADGTELDDVRLDIPEPAVADAPASDSDKNEDGGDTDESDKAATSA